MKTALLALAVAFAAAGDAQHCVDYGDFLHQTGLFSIHTEHLVVHDDLLFLTTYTGLNCYDISDSGSFVLLDGIEITNGLGPVAVTDGVVYVITGTFDVEPYWLTVVDATDPIDLQIVGTVDLPTFASAVAVNATRLLVAADDMIVVFDVSEPTAPQSLGNIPLDQVSGLATSGSWGFAAAADTLHVLDLAAVGLPEPAGSIPIPGGATAVAVAGMMAHVVGGQGLHVVDCSDPWHPEQLGEVAIPGSASRIVTGDGVAYVAVRDRGLATVDVSDPWSPRRIGGILSIRSARDVAVTGTTVYLACWDLPSNDLPGRGIMVIDASNPASPRAIGTLDFGVAVHDLCIVDDLAYVLTDHEQQPLDVLRVVDVSQPDQPQTIHEVDLPDGAVRLAAAPPLLIVGYDVGRLAIFEVSAPDQLQQLSEIELSAELNIVVTAGQYAYAGVGYYIWGAIQGVDLTDPWAPSIFYDTYFGHPGAMGTNGTHLVVAGLHGEISPDVVLKTLDISDPPEVHGCGQIYLGEFIPTCLTVAGHRVAMAGYHDEEYWAWPILQYVDISDPAAPHPRSGSALARDAGAVALSDAVAYVGMGEVDHGALQVFSATDLSDMQTLGCAPSSGQWRAVAASGELVYGLVSPSTLVILPAQCGETSAVADGSLAAANAVLDVSIHPNPCNPRASISFRVAAPTRVEVGVYDLRGALVAVLAGRVFPAGEHTLVWDGNDADGRGAAAGVYCVRITAGRMTATEKLVLVR